jgi:hypothetical protein
MDKPAPQDAVDVGNGRVDPRVRLPADILEQPAPGA